MKKASVRDLRYNFKKIERLLHLGKEIQITKRRRVIARLIPENAQAPVEVPDFMARLRAIYGNKSLKGQWRGSDSRGSGPLLRYLLF